MSFPSHPEAGPFGLNVVGNLASEKGLGEAVRAMVRSARAAGIRVALHDVCDTGAANIVPDLKHGSAGFPFAFNLHCVNADSLPWLAQHMDLRRVNSGKYSIGYWFWELPECPPEWADHFTVLDEIWVGSTFIQDAVARSSPVPVVCMPPALDPDPPVGRLDRAVLRLPPEAFVFLFVFDAASTLTRKNPAGLVRAFRAAFPSERNVRLVIKSSRLDRAPDKEDLFREAVGDDRILLLGGLLARPDVTALLALADCYVSLHRSEGFGLTLAESMLLGKPVIATGYSGNLDFMTSRNSLLVDSSPVVLDRDHGPYPAGQTWADPNLGQASELMRWVFANREKAAALGRRGRAEVAARFSPETIGRRIADRLTALQRLGRVPGLTAGADAPIELVGGPVVADEGRTVARDVIVRRSAAGNGSVRGRWLDFNGLPLAAPPACPMIRVAADRTPVTIHPPADAGDYLLELAAELGSATARVEVQVVPPAVDIDYRRVYAAADLTRDYWTVVGPSTREEYDRLGRVKLDLLIRHGLVADSRLLDVGCGTGQLTRFALEFLSDNGAYHGTDVAERAVAYCRAEFRRPNFSFSRNAVAALDVEGRTFDAACFFSVFTHTSLAETAGLLVNAARLLAPGGFIFADAFLSASVRTEVGNRGLVVLNPDRFAAIIEAAGLRAEEVMSELRGRTGRRAFFRMTGR